MEPDNNKIKILFVDDEPYVLNALRRLFFEESYEIFTANSGKEGLEIVQTNDVAVIVSDQRMPEMSGAEFLERVKDISPDSIRIILTGYADVSAAIDAINRGGAFRYITKPWNDDELRIIVAQAADTHRLIRQNRYLTELTKRQNEELQKWNTELEMYVQQQTIELTKQNQELSRLNEKLKRNFRDFISVLSNLNELRDKSIANHSNNVARLSLEMAKKMGLTHKEVEDIAIAAQLHDIGKIGISDIILSKEIDALNSDEIDEYKKHPILGQTSVDCIEELRDIGIIIRHHHESFDGSGFPDGISGETIPLGSRIIAIADRFIRLLPQKISNESIDWVLKVIKESCRESFDPSLFSYLRMAVKENLDYLNPFGGRDEIELPLKALRPGMVISRDIKTGTGLLILRANTVMDEEKIATIKRILYLDPVKTGVFVRIEEP